MYNQDLENDYLCNKKESYFWHIFTIQNVPLLLLIHHKYKYQFFNVLIQEESPKCTFLSLKLNSISTSFSLQIKDIYIYGV
jgi:hypothetical protein